MKTPTWLASIIVAGIGLWLSWMSIQIIELKDDMSGVKKDISYIRSAVFNQAQNADKQNKVISRLTDSQITDILSRAERDSLSQLASKQ